MHFNANIDRQLIHEAKQDPSNSQLMQSYSDIINNACIQTNSFNKHGHLVGKLVDAFDMIFASMRLQGNVRQISRQDLFNKVVRLDVDPSALPTIDKVITVMNTHNGFNNPQPENNNNSRPKRPYGEEFPTQQAPKKNKGSKVGKAVSRDKNKKIFEETLKYFTNRLPKKTGIGKDLVKIIKGYDSKYNRKDVKQQINIPFIEKCHSPSIKSQPKFGSVQVQVLNQDTFTAAQSLVNQGYKTAVLNMANDSHVGGGVKNGASAQEESLCRRSNLYLSLLKAAQLKNYSIGAHNTLLSKGVTVCKDAEHKILHKSFQVDVISNAAKKFGEGEKDKNYYKNDLPKRIRSILNTAINNGNTAIVLGAHGCGAFHGDPKKVSKAFLKVLQEQEYKGQFQAITFAVIDDKNGTNHKIFHDRLHNKQI